MSLAASAPARIDLAGGTLDIWPLFLLHEGAVTVNAAIELRAHVEARRARDGKVTLVSIDRRQKTVRPASRPVRPGERLELLARLAAAFGPSRGVVLSSNCDAPAGSGLGGSSALAIAAASVLAGLAGRRHRREDLIAIVRDLETKVLRIPAGVQDYYPAAFGGAAALHLEPGGIRREPIPLDGRLFASRVVLCDSGRSRSSGISNWDMMRRRLSGEKKIAGLMERIAEAAGAMRRGLLGCDWDVCGEALDAEWQARRRLSPLVETPSIAGLLAVGRRAGAIGGKVCGAGGGGCIVFIVRAGRKESVETALTRAGGSVLPVRLARQGVVWE